ncbi:MAG: hypothetical protein ABIU05_01925 [Nitrospirales bacterium]
MKVIATKIGIINGPGETAMHLRKVGDVFEISDELNEGREVIAFSEKWMERVETPEKPVGL